MVSSHVFEFPAQCERAGERASERAQRDRFSQHRHGDTTVAVDFENPGQRMQRMHACNRASVLRDCGSQNVCRSLDTKDLRQVQLRAIAHTSVSVYVCVSALELETHTHQSTLPYI